MAQEMTFEQFAQQPGAIEFIGLLKAYTDRGMSLEGACAAIQTLWQTLMDNVTDGLHRDTSRWNERANALKSSLANQVWHEVNNSRQQFASATDLADWLDTLHDCGTDGSVGAYKWAPAQAAAKAARATGGDA